MYRIPALLAVLSLPCFAVAAPAFVMEHSGRLLDDADAPVTAEALKAEFKFFAASSPQNDEPTLWASGQCTVVVKRGFYAVSLGAGSNNTDGCGSGLDPATLPPGGTYYLEVSFGGIKLLPRLRVGSVPSAAVAVTSLDSQALGTALKSVGTINATTNPVDWSQLKGVPASLADGTDDAVAAGAGLELVSGALGVKAGGITPSMLGTAGTSANQVLVTGTSGATWGRVTTAGLDSTGANAGQALLATTGGGAAWGRPMATGLDATGATAGQLLVAGSGGSTTWGRATADALDSTGATTGQALLAGSNGVVAWGNVVTGITLAANSGLTGDGKSASTGLAIASAEGSLSKVSGGAMTASGGSIGIGQGSPVVKLDVNGGLRLGGVADNLCTTANVGILRFQNDKLQACVASGWQTIAQSTQTIVNNGGVRQWSDGTSAASCQAYRVPTSPYTYAGATGDGVYSLKVGSGTAFSAYCDMTADNGGWTLVAKVNGADSNNLLYAAWAGTGTVGNTADFSTSGGSDVLYPSHQQVTANELLFQDSQTCGSSNRLLQTASILGGKTLRQYLADLPTAPSSGANNEANFTTPVLRNTGCTNPFQAVGTSAMYASSKFGINISDAGGGATTRFSTWQVSYDAGIGSNGPADGSYQTGDLDVRSDGVDGWSGHVVTVFVR